MDEFYHFLNLMIQQGAAATDGRINDPRFSNFLTRFCSPGLLRQECQSKNCKQNNFYNINLIEKWHMTVRNGIQTLKWAMNSKNRNSN